MTKIKHAFETVVTALAKDPALGLGTGVTTARIRDGLTCDIESSGFRFVADLPPTAGGDGRGPTPGMYGRGALAACLAMGYAMRAARAGIVLSNLEVEVEADYDDGALFGVNDQPPGYSAVRWTVTATTTAPEAEVLAILDDADAHSPYLDVFRRAQRCERTVKLTTSSATAAASE
jgi:uncharacterized OsmC-like protein